ncbi:MAG TPA: hypothetical protein VMS02_08290 [Solirubrobacteraceae bacterium]|nr:hypothetical protein [Solirubrobacteraceae bacterium]
MQHLIRRLLAPALLCALLILAAAAVAAKAPIKGASYRGMTSPPGASSVTFKVSANGKQVLNFTTHLGYNGKCGQGGGPTYEVKAHVLALHGGRFAGTAKGTLGTIKPVTVKISGRIAAGNASGSVVEPAGFRCKSIDKGANAYSETFTAKAA